MEPQIVGTRPIVVKLLLDLNPPEIGIASWYGHPYGAKSASIEGKQVPSASTISSPS
jgi:hypothetical protein